MRKLSILLAEDTPEWATEILKILEPEGHDSEIGKSYAEIQSKFHIRNYDLLIADLRLGPELNNRDGFFLLDEALSKGIPAIVITSDGSRDTMEKIDQLDVMKFIHKASFERDELLRLVTKTANSNMIEISDGDKEIARKLLDDLISGKPLR